MKAFALLLLVLAIVYDTSALDNGLGKTPPMGWSSWNRLFNDVNATVIAAMAEAMVAGGYKDAGYEYINIDAGYLVRDRDASGNLQVNATKFPDGMKAVADKLHALGLKLGVYTDITNRSCGLGPGSEGHYEQDARQFASWGADYLKVDYCGAMHMGPNDYTQWAALRDALNATGRPIYYSICPKTNAPGNGTATPYAHRRVYSPPQNWTASERHALSNSQLVEYTNNGDTWWSTDPSHCVNVGTPCGMISNVDAMIDMTHLSYSAPGSWNDADMLQVCNLGLHSTGMTREEYRASFSVWSVMASPLILSADLRSSASDEMRACLKDITLNAEVIAVNQDPAGHAAFVVAQTAARTPVEGPQDIASTIVARPLSNGDVAVVLFNRLEEPAQLKVSFADVGLPAEGSASVRDLWLQKDLGLRSSFFNATVPAHAAVMVRMKPASR